MLVLSTSYGLVKLQIQRTHPPPFATGPANTFDGFVAIDGHVARARLFELSYTGAEDAREALAGELRSGYHPNALLVPAAVGLVAALTGSVVTVFGIASGLAMLLTVLGVARLAGQHGFPPGQQFVAVMIFLAHTLVFRTACQLHLDPFCCMFTVWVMSLSLAACRRPTLAGIGVLTLVLTGAQLVKVSTLPLLAVPAVYAIAIHGLRSTRTLVLALGPPALTSTAVLALLLSTGSLERLGVDFEHLAASHDFRRSHLTHFAVEMVLLFQLFPLLFARRPASRTHAATYAVGALILAGTWATGLPPIPRLYLPMVPVIAIACAPFWERVFGSRARLALRGYLAANLAVSAIGLAALV